MRNRRSVRYNLDSALEEMWDMSDEIRDITHRLGSAINTLDEVQEEEGLDERTMKILMGRADEIRDTLISMSHKLLEVANRVNDLRP